MESPSFRSSDLQPTLQLEFRPCCEGDIPSIVAIENESYDRPWSESMFRHELENTVSHPMGVFLEGRMVGYIFFWLIEEDIHINNIAIGREYRKQGIGRALLRHALTWGRENGATCATLEVRPSNTPALSLYESFGFTEEGRRKKYYWDTGEDALILWLNNLKAFATPVEG